MNYLDAKYELNKIYQKYQSYKKQINNKNINHQNAINNLYSIFIKRELKKIWNVPFNNNKSIKKLRSFLTNWYKEIKIFKRSVK